MGKIMETTALYVEYIVIGMETLSWIVMSFFILVGDSFKQIIKYCISNILPSIIIVIVCYILGLVTDRIADKIFENRRKNIKDNFEFQAQTSIAIWEDFTNSSYANFTLSRIRILRSTTINIIIIGILGLFLAYKHFGIKLSLFILILSICIFFSSNSAHKNLLNNYYRKTSALENEKNKTKKGEHKSIILPR